MKIAFVGKGGSGKSTTSSLFIKYLLSIKQKLVVIDADINMHMAPLLGVEHDEKLALSENGNPVTIRTYLKGKNTRIKTVNHFVKTTPPGNGSELVTFEEENFLLKNFASKLQGNNYFMHVGSYSEEEIGTACYHTNLSILENILSHTVEKNDEWVIVDMVAGTDAFSGSLHLQFDAIFLVVEPTPESLSVYTQYKKLSEKAGTLDRLFCIGNKVEDDTDLDYIKSIVTKNKLVGYIPSLKSLRKARQGNREPALSDLPDTKIFQDVKDLARSLYQPTPERLKKLYALHKRHAKEEWIVSTLGDVTDQIDPGLSLS